MANTADTSMQNNIIEVTYSGSGDDWNSLTDTGIKWLKVKSIQWHPTAADDILVINEGGIDGPSIIHTQASGADDTKVKYFGENGTWMYPFIDLTDCTFDDCTATKIIFELA